MCCWFHSHCNKKSCEDRNDRCWAHEKALSICSPWSVGLHWGSHYIVCGCIVLSNSTGNKCQNLPSLLTCFHCVRLHGWLWVKFSFTGVYIHTLTKWLTFSLFLKRIILWYCIVVWKSWFFNFRLPSDVKKVFHPIICCALSADLTALAFGYVSKLGFEPVLGIDSLNHWIFKRCKFKTPR